MINLSLPDSLRRLWTRLWLRRSQFSGRYGDLEKLYSIKDPWQLASPRERQRFEATNALIVSLAGPVENLLELGCGEGFQTIWLAKIAAHVSGLDVSQSAVERARLAVPDADLKTGQAEDAAALFPGRRFDIVTAFEVLYYSNDVPRVLAGIQQLADIVLVTSYAARAKKMRHHFAGPGWQRLPDITAEGTVWECNVWRRPTS